MNTTWSLERGGQLQSDNSVRFTVWAPRATAPAVRVRTAAGDVDHPLAAVDGQPGVFTARIEGIGAGTDYWYVLGGGAPALPDPVSRWQPHGVHGASRVVDPASHTWTDAGWSGIRVDELVIYELHVGTFTPEGTFAAVIPRLANLRSLGVTAIEIMPVAQFPGDRNWGYDGVGLYAVQNTYGGPDGLRALVDAAHSVGLAVILDVVYNHVGPEGNYLDAFGPYFTEKYTTPWGRALNYDDADSDEVRRFVVDNALHWITEYHIDGLRLDAVHGIFDFSATHLLEEIADAVRTQAALLGRSVVVIGESDLNDPKLLRDQSEFGYGLDAQWSDDFHHAVHALFTRESNGYYVDFGTIDAIADALREPFVYDGRYSRYRRRRHGASSRGLPRRRFVVAIQNHDQVGNRAAGERLGSLLTLAQVRVATALLLLSPYVPLIFMGDEFGETNPFQYFVSHGDEQLVRAVREGRRAEFASFGWGESVPDPQDDATFARSKLDWSKATREPHSFVLALYRDLLALRRDEPLLRPDGATLSVSHGNPGWITLLRTPIPGVTSYVKPLVAVFNCSDSEACVPMPTTHQGWHLRLSTDAPAYGGSGCATAFVSSAQSDAPRRLLEPATASVLHIAPWTASLYQAAAD